MVKNRSHPNATLVYFEPRNDTQRNAISVYDENDVLFLLGPAGTGKTHFALYCALRDARFVHDNQRNNKGFADHIIMTRPIIEAGEKLGALPGEIHEKVNPYMQPLYDCMSSLLANPRDMMQYFELSPLAYMRGRTFNDAVAILDEAQNCTFNQLLMFMTRLGKGSKIIITGDPSQNDIPNSGLIRFANMCRGIPGVGFMEFADDDVVRHPIVREVIRRCRDAK